MNLLIVDDDVPTTEVLRDCLDRELIGIEEIYTAHHAAAARRVFEEKSVDVVLCDIEMPGESGLRFLEWVREKESEKKKIGKTEFIFLTCYERFEYAREAVEHEASNYLLKPIDMGKITEALLKAAGQLHRRQKLEEYRRMGEYWQYGQLRIARNFWYRAVMGYVGEDSGHIREEMEHLGLDMAPEGRYTMVYLRIDRGRMFEKDESKELCRFIIENILSQSLERREVMEDLMTYEDETDFYAAAFVNMDPEETERRCGSVWIFLKTYYGENFTCYISELLDLGDLHEAYREMRQYDKNNLSGRGMVLRFKNRQRDVRQAGSLLDQTRFLSFMENGERRKAMEYVESVCRRIESRGVRSIHSLRSLQQEVTQGIYVYLHQRNINASLLFGDAAFQEMQERAAYSVYGLLKYSTCCVSRAMDYSDEVQKKGTIVGRMITYLNQHFTEEITRNQVAEQVYLTPEYVGKIFKKETGLSIQDYVARMRIQKAADLLSSPDCRVTDAALAVGFQNIPYFSTVFKKYMGVTPKEYKEKRA